MNKLIALATNDMYIFSRLDGLLGATTKKPRVTPAAGSSLPPSQYHSSYWRDATQTIGSRMTSSNRLKVKV